MIKTIRNLLLKIFFITLWSNCVLAKCIEGDCNNGYGIYSDSEGRDYVGGWKNGSVHGSGTHSWADGQKYIGELENGNFHGYGFIVFSNGEKYLGEWVNGSMSGTGIFIFPNGNKYQGEFQNGYFNGKGTFTYSNGKELTGLWKDDVLQNENLDASSNSEILTVSDIFLDAVNLNGKSVFVEGYYVVFEEMGFISNKLNGNLRISVSQMNAQRESRKYLLENCSESFLEGCQLVIKGIINYDATFEYINIILERIEGI